MRNTERTERTRGKLIDSGRRLFAEKGYSDTPTEAIIEAAGVTRGALYHHFRDKAELFEAICRELSLEAMAAIEAAVKNLDNPLEGLETGSLAWIDYVLQPGVRRILVIEAPMVLGLQRWRELDDAHAFQLLRAGTDAAVQSGAVRFAAGSEALAVLLNGAMNAIVLRLGSDASADIATGRAAVRELISMLAKAQ